MLETIEQLLVLQDRDTNLAKAKQELEKMPEADRTLVQKAETLPKQFEEMRKDAQKVEAQRKEISLEIQARQAQIAKCKGRQLETRKNEEYQALTNEITHLEKEIQALEDRELEFMEQYEVASKKVAEEETKVGETVKGVEGQRTGLKEKKGALEARVTELEKEIAELEKPLDPDVLDRYRRILKSKKDKAIVPLVHETTCGGCHMKQPQQLCLSVKAGNSIETCNQCGRILYWSLSA